MRISLFALFSAIMILSGAVPAHANDGYVALRGGASFDGEVRSGPLGFETDTNGWHACIAGGRQIGKAGPLNLIGELEACMDRAQTREIGVPFIASIKGEVTNYSAGPNLLLELEMGRVRPYAGGGVAANVQCANAETQGFGNLIQVQGCNTGLRWRAIAGADVDIDEAKTWAIGTRYSYEDTAFQDDLDVSFLGVVPLPGFQAGPEHRISFTVKRRF